MAELLDSQNGRQYPDRSYAAIASGAHTDSKNGSALTNYDYRGVALLIDVTAKGNPAGQINDVLIQALIGSTWVTIYTWSGVNFNDLGQHALLLYPGASSAGNWKAAPLQGVLPQTWRVRTVHNNNTGSLTYGVTAVYVP